MDKALGMTEVSCQRGVVVMFKAVHCVFSFCYREPLGCRWEVWQDETVMNLATERYFLDPRTILHRKNSKTNGNASLDYKPLADVRMNSQHGVLRKSHFQAGRFPLFCMLSTIRPAAIKLVTCSVNSERDFHTDQSSNSARY